MLRRVALVRTEDSEERIASTIRGKHVFLRNEPPLIVTANVVPISPIHVTQMREAIHPSQMSVLTRATWRKISEDGVLNSAITYDRPWLLIRTLFLINQKTNSVAFSQQANYTDCATATCWRNLMPTFADRGVSHGQCGGSPTVVNLSFLCRNRYFSFFLHKG
jgi:hypothetical protein